jgi:replicative DNA helicase
VTLPPPEDPETEAALLGTVLTNGKEYMPVARKMLRVDDFTREAHRATFATMVSLWEQETPISYTTVAAVLRKNESLRAIGAEQFLVGLMEKVMDLNVEAHAKRIRLLGTARELISALGESGGIAYAVGGQRGIPAKDPEELLTRVLAPIERVMVRGDGGKILTSDEVAHRYYADLVDRMDGGERSVGIPMGFPQLDEIMSYRMGELIIVAGESGSGKTAFMGSLCDALGDRLPMWNDELEQIGGPVPALFVSIEQPVPQLMDRVVAHRSGINSLRLAKGRINDDELTQIGTAMERIAKRPLYYIDHGTMTTAALDAHIQIAVAKYGVRIVFVDYVQLLADQHGDGMAERVAYISGRLRQIARRHNVCIVAGSQLSRQGRLRWAGELEQDPFIIMRLNRAPKDSTTQVHIDKNRNGPAGMNIPIYFDHETAHFSPHPIRRDEP